MVLLTAGSEAPSEPRYTQGRSEFVLALQQFSMEETLKEHASPAGQGGELG